MRRFVGSVSDDRALAVFADVYAPFTISQGLFCWCPGGECLDASEFTVQLGRFGVAGTFGCERALWSSTYLIVLLFSLWSIPAETSASVFKLFCSSCCFSIFYLRCLFTASGPTFIAPRVVVGSYFTVQLIGPSLNTDDAISIRGPTDLCGDPGTQNMDPDLVMKETNRTLNSLGTVESFSVLEDSASGDTEMTWTSWGMRIKTTVQGYMKICYCPSTEQDCDSSGSKLVLAGLLETRGPSKEGVELIGTALQSVMYRL